MLVGPIGSEGGEIGVRRLVFFPSPFFARLILFLTAFIQIRVVALSTRRGPNLTTMGSRKRPPPSVVLAAISTVSLHLY